MLCVITHVCRYAKYHSYSAHRKQVNNLIKTFFNGLSLYETAVTLDIFWTEYTESDKNNVSFDGDEFIQKKDTIDGNSHLWHKTIHYLTLMFLVS